MVRIKIFSSCLSGFNLLEIFADEACCRRAGNTRALISSAFCDGTSRVDKDSPLLVLIAQVVSLFSCYSINSIRFCESRLFSRHANLRWYAITNGTNSLHACFIIRYADKTAEKTLCSNEPFSFCHLNQTSDLIAPTLYTDRARPADPSFFSTLVSTKLSRFVNDRDVDPETSIRAIEPQVLHTTHTYRYAYVFGVASVRSFRPSYEERMKIKKHVPGGFVAPGCFAS